MSQERTVLERAEEIIHTRRQSEKELLPPGVAFELLVSDLARLLHSEADDRELTICAHRELSRPDTGQVYIREECYTPEHWSPHGSVQILVEDGRVVHIGRGESAAGWGSPSASVFARR
jgi:hypothetical protein